MSILLIILYALSCVTLLYSCVPPQKKKLRHIARPAMLISAVLCYLLCAEYISIPIVLALILFACGGVMLLRSEQTGMVKRAYACYALALILYGVLCLLSMTKRPTALVCVLGVAVYGAVIFGILYKLIPSCLPEVRPYVCIETAAAGFFAVSSMLFAFHGGSAGSKLIYIGSFFWIICSVLHLIHRYRRKIKMGVFYIMLTNIVAISLIVFGSVA